MGSYILNDPRYDTRGIADTHQGWCRDLPEQLTEQQQITLQWLYDTSPPKQRKYVIIEDKRVECCVNRVLYRKHHEFGWCKVTSNGGYIRVNG